MEKPYNPGKKSDAVRKGNAPYISENVIVLRVGSGKGHHIELGGFSSPGVVHDWYDVYENKTVKESLTPLPYHAKMELVELAQEGVRAGTIDRLTELLNVTKKQASGFFHFSERSLNDYIKKDKILDPDSSEKILKMFSLYLYGLEVFGSREGFVNWLSKPSFGLRNKKPIALLSSSDGIDLIQEELSRIEFGDLS